jgi:pyruvate,water dikinase
MSQSYSNPLDHETGPTTQWTRVNIAESAPGVVVPLHWDFSVRAGERGVRWGFWDRGVIPRSEVPEPEETDRKLMATFLGRLATNVDLRREFYDRIPGTSGDDIEFAMLGSVRPDASSHPTTRRYRYIREREPKLRAHLDDRTADHYAKVRAWWQECCRPDVRDDVGGARARWRRACAELEHGTRLMAGAAHFAGEAFARLARTAAAVGRPALATRLNGGYGDTHDHRTSVALWKLARGGTTLADFLAEYGYQGNRAAYLAATVWREDPSSLDPVLGALAVMPEDEGPVASGVTRADDRRRAEAELLAAVRTVDRDEVERVLADARRFTVMRELVKATSQRALDVGRAASRTLGRDFVGRRLLDAPEDVFHLVGAEFLDVEAPELRQRVAFRRSLAAEYESFDIPLTFAGPPAPVPRVAPESDGVRTFGGIGVSSGVAEGLARVVTDPALCDPLRPGEILVCATTDPSWVGLFVVAKGLVIDIGGPMSHGAIVARELGVPCVVNTKSGTTHVRTGDVVRIDGERGVVEVLERGRTPS